MLRSLPLESEHTDLGFETLKQIEGLWNICVRQRQEGL